MYIVLSSKRMETHNVCNCVCLVVRGYCNCPWGGGSCPSTERRIVLFKIWGIFIIALNTWVGFAEVAKGQFFLRPTDNCGNKLANCAIRGWTTNIVVLCQNWFASATSPFFWNVCLLNRASNVFKLSKICMLFSLPLYTAAIVIFATLSFYCQSNSGSPGNRFSFVFRPNKMILDRFHLLFYSSFDLNRSYWPPSSLVPQQDSSTPVIALNASLFAKE